MATITKSKVSKNDCELWTGTSTKTFSRATSTGGSQTLQKIDWPGVDVLQVYGAGTSRTLATLQAALAGVGTANKVNLFLSPGTWAVTDDLTITDNINLVCPAGVSLSVTAAKTLTIEGQITAGAYQIFAGSGTVTFTGDGATLGVWSSGGSDSFKFDILSAGSGTTINEFSIDGTLAGNSDNAVPTEKAVKTYADTKAATADVVTKALFDANTILAANTDDTPAAVTVAEDRLVGRISGGNIVALTQSQVKTFLGGIISPTYYKHNLVVKTASTSTVDIDADEIVLTDGTNFYLAEDVDVTANLAAAGANGLDTGSEANSTMYYAWAIYNGSTVASLLSASATDPTMPSGYTYKRLVAECYNDSGGDLVLFNRQGDKVWFEDPQAIYTSQTLTTAFVEHNLPGACPSGVTELFFEASSGVAGTRTLQVLSPDSTTRFEVAIFKTAGNLSGSDQSPTGGFNPVHARMHHCGAVSIYARSCHTSNIADQHLHVWGYERER